MKYKLELELENKYAYLLNGENKNLSSNFEQPASIRKISANFKHYAAVNPLPPTFIQLGAYANAFWHELPETILISDVLIYLADKIWDEKLFKSQIVSPHWALLAAARHARRHDRSSFHEAFTGIYKGLKEIGLDSVAKDIRFITDQIIQRTEAVAIDKYSKMLNLLSENNNKIMGLLGGSNK